MLPIYMCANQREDPSFEEIFEEVSWELCIEAASMAVTDLSIMVCNDFGTLDSPKRAKSIEEAVEWLMETKNGGVRILGTWKAGGKRGKIELIYLRLLSPTATSTFVVRYLNESIRLKIAKELMRIKNPDVELLDVPQGSPDPS
jgi:hypothetical protein